jgi:hypothetical protein
MAAPLIPANSDRWADDAFLSRDLIDLAALRLHVGSIPAEHRRTCFERLDVRGADALVPLIEALRVESLLLLES